MNHFTNKNWFDYLQSPSKQMAKINLQMEL